MTKEKFLVQGNCWICGEIYSKYVENPDSFSHTCSDKCEKKHKEKITNG